MKKLITLLLVFLLSCPLPVWAGESRFDQIRVESAWSDATTPDVTPGDNDAYIKGTLEVDGVARFDASTITLRGVTYTLPSADGTNGQQLTTNGSAMLSWGAAGTPAWDDIGNPDANDTITFGTYTATLTGSSTAADQFNFLNTGNFGDISVVKIQQLTGDPTNGTMLEVTAADTNVDGIVVSNTTADLTADSTLLTLSLTDDGDANGIFLNCLDNSGADSKFKVADDGNTTIAGTLGVTGAITASGGISIADQALTGTTGIIDYTNFDVDAAGAVTAVSGTFSGNVGAVDGTFSGDLTVSGSADIGTIKMDALTPSGAAPQAISLNGAGAGGVNIGNVSTGAVAIGGTASAITLGASTTMSDGKNLTVGEGYVVIDNDATDETALTITSDATTSGGAIGITSAATTTKIVSVVADDLGSGGMMFYLDSDNIAADNYYLYCYDGTNPDFTVAANGLLTIAGGTSSDAITATAGHIQVTDGDVDIDEGKITVDTTSATDLSYIKMTSNTDVAADAAIFTIENTDSNAANANYLLRLRRTADGDAQDHFLVLEDNNGDDKVAFNAAGTTTWTLDAGGSVVIDGSSTASTTTGGVLDVDMSSATTGGDAINVKVVSTVGAGETSSAITVDLDDDTAAAGSIYGLDIAASDATGSSTLYGINIANSIEVGANIVVGAANKALVIDADSTANTGTAGVVDMGYSTVTNGASGINLDMVVGNAGAGVTAHGILIDVDDDTVDNAATINAMSVTSSDVAGHASTVNRAFYTSGMDVALQADNGYVRIGTGSSPDLALGDDVLYVEGTAEVDGNADIGGTLTMGKEVLFKKGDDIASPAGGELTLGDGTFFDITGVNNITSIAAASSTAGRLVILQFDGVLTFTDGNNLKIAGNFVTSADDTITLICDGTNWWELSRSAN